MKLKVTLPFILFVGFCFGQQETQYTQLLSTPYLLNPAAGGLMNVAEVTVGNRMQFVGAEGRPMTNYASIQSLLRFKKRKAEVLNPLESAGKTFYSTPQRVVAFKQVAGLTFVNDAIGPFTRNLVKANFAVHLPITQKLAIGAGLGLGWSNFGINQSRVSLESSNDQAYMQYLGNSSKQNMVDAQAGIVMYNDQFFLGISGSQLFKNKIRFAAPNDANYFAPHLLAIASYRFDFAQHYGIEPIVQFKYVKHAPVTFDAGARFHYKRMGWLSVSYRRQSAIGVGFGLNLLARFNLSYTYEFGTGATQKFGANTHEMRLGFIFGKKPKQDKKTLENQTDPELDQPVE
jgi:type IX secretion system PorP/SprF family membrane protein